MSIWAIADIHASRRDPQTGAPAKPMDVFGPEWEDHVARIEASWRQDVQPEDTVIIAGDIDWALHLEDAMDTLSRIAKWPGRKLLTRGNHDYWWSSKTTNKVRRQLPASTELIHNDSVAADGFNICGAKGSNVPGSIDWTPENEKLLNREAQRLRNSLESREPDLPTIVATHYPPFYQVTAGSVFTELMEACGVVCCVYGHLHGNAAAMGPSGEHGGILYRLVAADAVGFRPVVIASDGVLLGDAVTVGSALTGYNSAEPPHG
jgi:predicted phosphohydrolase